MSTESAEIIPENDKTRFQVNRVRTESNAGQDYSTAVKMTSEDDNTDDETCRRSLPAISRRNSEQWKSFRQFTREVLPRLDNYRNILSIRASKRPTLDELHNETLLNKAGRSMSVVNGKLPPNETQIKFGWIKGVFMRCLLNIWGVILFLRLSWVVAQAGIGQSFLLILSTTAVTSITALSMSAISTNGIIKGGGTYYMISRSLGPEFGGSIGLIFALANAAACAMYVVGFCESLGDLLSSFGLSMVDGGVQDARILGSITMVAITMIVIVGMEWEAKAQFGLLIILLVAIVDVLIGSFIPPSDEARAKGFVGYNITVLKENFYSDYRRFEGIDHDFFSVFAIFFPAATGILAGANISGDLKDPQSAIPKGTLLAIVITTVSYLLIAFICGFTVLRDATGNITSFYCEPGECSYGLHNSFQVVELVSWVGPLIYAGCFAATLSSALASLVSAPKVFQALCKDKLYPGLEWFGKGYGKNQEPVRSYILTFVIAIGFILIGQLNSIAPLISNFFLAAYTLINFSTFHASLAKPVGWRPTFKYYNMWLSLLGSIFCVLVMFLISWCTALVTFVIVLALYLLVSLRKPDVNWGSTTQAQIYKNALQAAQQLNSVEDHVKNYRPQILVLSGMPSARPALVDFAYLITKNLSVLICGHVNTTRLPQRTRNALNHEANAFLKTHKLKAFYMQVDGLTFEEGSTALLKASGIGKLRPNILLMGYKSDWQNCSVNDREEYFSLLHNAFDLHLAVGILRLQGGLDCTATVLHVEDNDLPNLTNIEAPLSKETEDIPKSRPSEGFPFQMKQKRSGTIDVWWLYDDGGLTLLLPYIMSTRKNWNNCKLRVFSLSNKQELESEHMNMANLLSKFRIDYSDLQMVSNTQKPQETTQKFFDSLIAGFKESEIDTANPSGALTEAELLAVKDKTNRYLRLRELLLEHSQDANIIVMTLPMPRKGVVPAPLYFVWLEVLTRDMPPMLLVRGNQTPVLTFYS